MEDRETPRMHKYGESKTTRIMMATVRHVTSSSGHRKFQADGLLFDWVVYKKMRSDQTYCSLSWTWKFRNMKLRFTVCLLLQPAMVLEEGSDSYFIYTHI